MSTKNQLFVIDNAKVINVGQYATGTTDNGPWASIQVKLEWEYQYTQEEQQPRKMSAYVTFKGETAVWVRDNVKAGNSYAVPAVPDMYIDVWCRLYASKRDFTKRDGTTGEDKETIIIGEFVQVHGR